MKSKSITAFLVWSIVGFSVVSAKETITLHATGCHLQKVEILDVNERVLYAVTLNGTETFDYNVSQIPSGIYLARVKTSCGVLMEKFSVK